MSAERALMLARGVPARRGFVGGAGRRTSRSCANAATLPCDRELVGQVHVIKRRVLSSGKVSFDAERNARGHADKF